MIGDSMDDMVEQCTYDKKGVCNKHGVKGDRSEVKTRTWRKKKFGYGYVTSRKIVYSCNLGRQSKDIQNPVTSDDICLKPTLQSKGIMGLGSDNDKWGNVGGIRSSVATCMSMKGKVQTEKD